VLKENLLVFLPPAPESDYQQDAPLKLHPLLLTGKSLVERDLVP